MGYEDASAQFLANGQPSEIKERIAERRASITEKIEVLEGRVEERVMQTLDYVTQEIEQTVSKVSETVQQTVDEMAAGMQDTFHKVNSKVQDVVDGVGSSVDLQRHYDEKPFAMLGVSVFVGLVLGRMLRSR